MGEKIEAKKAPQDLLKDIYDRVLRTVDSSKGERGKADPAKELVVLKDAEKGPFEAPKLIWEKNFPLGKYSEVDEAKRDAEKPVISDKAVYFLNGSVDRISFNKKTKRENIVAFKFKDSKGKDTEIKWYEDTKSNAAYFLKYADRIDFEGFDTMDTPVKKARMAVIMTKISEMEDHTDVAWNKMIADNKFADNEVFGPAGAYNLLLAFGRAAGNIDLEEDTKVVIGKDANLKDITVPAYNRIKLQLAKKRGDRPKDRFGKIVEMKVKEEEKVPKPKPKPEPEPKPKPEPKPEPNKPEPKPQPKPQPKPEPIKPPVKPKEDSEEKVVSGMVEELGKNGFKLIKVPAKFGDLGYGKLGDKRVQISLNKDGTYNYKLLNLFDKNPAKIEGNNKNLADMKAALKAEPDAHIDIVKGLKIDLAKIPGYSVKLVGPLDKDASGAAYDPETYSIVISDYSFKKSTGVNAKLNTTFRATIDAKKGYKDIEDEWGKTMRPTDDVKELLKDIIDRAKDKNDK